MVHGWKGYHWEQPVGVPQAFCISKSQPCLRRKKDVRLSKLLFCSLTEGVGEGRLQTVFRRYSMRMVCIAGLAGLLSLLQTLAVYLLAQLFL